MKSKKVLSSVVASALVATTMSMPVMAAGGKVEVNVSTKEAVIRVEVPTAMEIAVDQFESADAGTQIYSEPFTMKNKSGVDVKVGVESAATGGTAGLVATTDAVKTSTSTTGEAWLAVAAQTEADKYGVDSMGELTEASSNVATFDATEKKAAQTFYLGKGTGDVGYKMLVPTAAKDPGDVTYAQFYVLTEKGSGFTASSEQDDLNDLLAAGDVYVDEEGTTATDGHTLKLVKKGDAATYNSAYGYYTADMTTVKTVDDLAASTPYIYAETAAVGGNAAFRYIGRLSEAKTSAWAGTDIGKITINYTIDGVTASTYGEASKDCTYGLYAAPTAPSITSAKSVKAEAATAVEFTVDLGAGSKGASGVASVVSSAYEGYNLLNRDNDVVYEDGKITFPAETIDYLLGEAEVTWPMTVTVTFAMNDSDAEAVEETVTLTK